MMALGRIFGRKPENYSKLRVSCDQDSLGKSKLED